MNQIVDESTENVVLGSLILNPDEYNMVAQYVPENEVFSQKKSKKLWEKITKMRQTSQHIDTLTVCSSITTDDMNSGITKSYVIDCTSNACMVGATEAYAQKIYEKYLLRRIVQESDKIKHDVLHYGTDVYELIGDAHTLMGELIKVRPGMKFSINEAMAETVKSMGSGDKRMIRTGYPKIDSFAGGLTRGEITIVGGRPGHGKTTFLVNLLASLVGKGFKVAVFNRELPNTEVLKKLICIEEPKLNYRDVRRGIFSEKTVELLRQSQKKITSKYSEDKFIMFDDVRDFPKTASEVKKFKPDVIIDDYIQLITPSTRQDTRRLQLEEICNAYKWLAKESNASVILASQLNRYLETRGGEHKRPQLSDLAESGAIEQVAENVFFIYNQYKVDPAHGSQNELRLIASKVRYGETGEVTLGYHGDICTIYDELPIPVYGANYAKEQLKIN
tara:strand:+ start:4211 stop:5551 length:1341 start_codon:yes stop_codon:yes gene_type:complete